jgi:TrmH family RNA methyltransferase
LKSKKGRAKSGRFLVEGRLLVLELLRSAYEIEAVLWDVSSDEPSDDLRSHPKVASRLVELSPAAFAQVADTSTPQGVIAVARIPHQQTVAMTAPAVLLDGMQDPGNVGTLFRTCEAFGIQTVCCGTNTVDMFAPKVVRSTMGGMFRLSLHDRDSTEFIEAWRAAFPSGQVVAAAAQADDWCYTTEMSHDTLIVIGSEAKGIRPEVLPLVDKLVSIPMQGQAESLNAAVAGSILAYEWFRQQHRRS